MDNAIKARNEAYAAFEHIPAKHQARAVEIARKGQQAFDAGQFERAANEWRQMMRLATMKNPKKKTGYEKDATEDIQHDLALFMADGEDLPEAREELKRRGAKIPQHARRSRFRGVDYDLNPGGRMKSPAQMEFLKMMRANKGKLPAFAWPGGYPIIYIDREGNVLCADCAKKALREGDPSRFPVAYSVFYEGSPEHCADCNLEIESAYGDPDEED